MKFFKLLFIVLTLSSCHSIKDTSIPKTTPTLLPGYTLIASPNSLDKPGSVIAVSKDGIPEYLGSIDVYKLDTGAIKLAEVSGKRRSSMSALINFLGMEKYSLNSNLNSKLNKEFEYIVSLNDCSEERIDRSDSVINNELEKKKQDIRRSDKNNMGDYKYYYVAAAIKAKKISYQFISNNVRGIDLKTNIQKLIDVNPQINWEDQNSLKLSCNLTEPLYIYARYRILNVQKQITGATIFKVGNEITQENPIYTKTK